MLLFPTRELARAYASQSKTHKKISDLGASYKLRWGVKVVNRVTH
jgi:hypothetical protein